MSNIVLNPTVDVAETLRAIDSASEGVVVLEPGHPWHDEPLDVWVRPESELWAAGMPEVRKALAAGESYLATFATFYDLEGRRIRLSEQPEGWWEKRAAGLRTEAYTSVPNAVARFGDDAVIVGRGHYFAVAETTLDDRPAIEFVTLDEMLRREGARRERFVAEHPVIEEHRPMWATRVDVELDGEGALVTYSRTLATLDVDFMIAQEARLYASGEFQFLDAPALCNGRASIVDGFGPIADDLRAFAVALGGIS